VASRDGGEITGRDPETHKFLPGHSGNPSGRVKGLRNKITLERLLLEDILRQSLAKATPSLLTRAIQMAMGHECDDCRVPKRNEKGHLIVPPCGGRKDGNDRMMRALLDKVLATPKHDDAGEAKDNEIKILIQNMTNSPSPKSEPGLTTVTVTPTSTQVDHNDGNQ
jgi:uncharacterized Zn finger protein (UPF0148 family)